MEQRKPVPYFNQDIELPLIIHIIRKNILLVLGVLIVLLMISFLYLRYTIPLYQASTVIQMNEEEKKLDFFDENQFNSHNIAKDIELIRSPVFIQRTVDSLPLEVSYFVKGRILDFDNYGQTPYSISIVDLNPAIYHTPVNIKFNDAQNYHVQYKLGKENFEFDLHTNLPQKTPHFQIQLTVNNPSACTDPATPMYFVFNDPKYIADQLSKKIKILLESEAAGTIRITVTDVNPIRAAHITNMMAKEFEQFNIEKKREGTDKIIDYIDDKISFVRFNLNEADSSLTTFKQKHKIQDKKEGEDPLEQSNIELLHQFENERVEYDIQLIVLKDVINNVNKPDLDIYQILTQISQIKTDSYLNGIVSGINVLIAKRDRLRQSLNENNREIQDVNNQIETQKKLLVTSLEAIRQSYESRVKELNKKISALESTFTGNNNTLPDQVEYIQRKRIFEVNQTYYELLIKKRADFEMLSEGYTSGYTILQYATPATSPVHPRKIFTLIIVFAAWLVISIAYLAARYLLHDRILDIEHITKYCNVSVLGMVGKYDSDIPVSQLVVDKKPKSLIAESFRNIRSNLDFISNKPGSKLIAVTSTISGEGKTFVSINLAGILAFTGKKVIIIDGDMRKPKIHVGFDVSNDKGLSNLLIGKNTLEETIQESTLANLHFITAGPIPPNPSELLLSEQMNQLIQTLQQTYDYVLIDNPPVGIVTDALSILQRADYPIYVFRANVSRKHFINNLNNLLADGKIQHLSIVLNGAEIKKSSRYGYGYGGYGYSNHSYGYYEEDKTKGKSWFRKK